MRLNNSHIEISRSAIQHNIQFLKRTLNGSSRLSSVVKGNAYGHGIEELTPIIHEAGVKHFSVFSADEAYRVHQVLPDVQIMIMGMIDHSALEWAISHEIEIYVFDLERLEAIVKTAKQVNKAARIHIELETGMNRTGFLSGDLPKVMDALDRNGHILEVRGLCTHLAGAESISNYYRIQRQMREFKRVKKKYARQLGDHVDFHTACSAAMLKYPSTRLDMVRIGILQYGFFPSREIMVDYYTKNKIHEYPLRRVISWKSRVMDIKEVSKGEFVGYGTSYLANEDMKVALVPVGYSHGFARKLSNTGRVLIRGQRLAVVGTVNMNMMSVDVTNLPVVEQGDEVVIIGYQGDHEVSVASFSETTQQVNYELLTRLPLDIPRRITP